MASGKIRKPAPKGYFLKLAENIDLNTLVDNGFYTVNSNVNVPYSAGYYNIFVMQFNLDPHYVIQVAMSLSSVAIAFRILSYTTWSNWHQISAT